MSAPQVGAAAAPIQLGEHLAVLRLRRWWIVVVAAITVGAALGLSVIQDKVYTSTAQVLVRPVPAPGTEGTKAAEPNMTTERQLAKSVPVAVLAQDALKDRGAPESLLKPLKVDVIADTEILEFTYESSTPAEAQRRTQAFADAYLLFRQQQALDESAATEEDLRQTLRALTAELRSVNTKLADGPSDAERTTLEAQQFQLAGQIGVTQTRLTELESAGAVRAGQIVMPADLPSTPSSPKPIRNAILALVVGIALGIGVALLIERVDDRFRTPDGLEATAGARVLSSVPRIPADRQVDGMLVTLQHPDSPFAEAYRTLRTGLMFAASGRGARTIVITSALPGDGKTVTTANLAVAIAQAGKRVVVISADLRRPELHRMFGRDSKPGLTDVLARRGDVWDLLVRPSGIDNLWLLPSGSIDGTPADLLSSHAMGDLLRQLRESADLVLIDTGPILSVPDAITLSPMVDGVVLVAAADRTTRASLRSARRQLDLVNATVLGAVLNFFRPARASQYYTEYSARPAETIVPEGRNA